MISCEQTGNVYSYRGLKADMDKLNTNLLKNGSTFYCIDTAPTVNAVIVAHGHWETNSDRPDSLICSVCKCGFDMWKHDPHNFCPNCGSKMDAI